MSLRSAAWSSSCGRPCDASLALFRFLFFFPLPSSSSRDTAHSPNPDAANRPKSSSRQPTQAGAAAGLLGAGLLAGLVRRVAVSLNTGPGRGSA